METGYMKPIKRWGNVKHVPVVSWIQAGCWKEAYEQGDYSEFVETDSKGEFALIVEGDSMEPEFHEGDIIVVNPYKKQENNDYVVVYNAEYKVYVESSLKSMEKPEYYILLTLLILSKKVPPRRLI